MQEAPGGGDTCMLHNQRRREMQQRITESMGIGQHADSRVTISKPLATTMRGGSRPAIPEHPVALSRERLHGAPNPSPHYFAPFNHAMIEGYRELKPGPPVDAYVHRMAYGYFPMPLPPEQLAPDSYIKWALILDGEPQYFDHKGRMDWHHGFCGHVPPERGIIATSNGPVRCVMVNFYPSAFHRLFGTSVHEFNGRMVPPSVIVGDRIETIYSAMRKDPEPSAMFDVLVAFITELHEQVTHVPVSPILALEARIRHSKGILPVRDMAASLGMSERQLQRRFKDEIGLSPKEFCSVVRFNHVYSHMQRTRRLDLDIALQCGYFDESHMLKDLAYFLGRTPKRFADLIRPMVDTSLGH